MKTNLMERLNVLVSRYINQYIAAPVKWGQRVFGQQMPTKTDVRRAFIKDLTMLAEVAKITGDTHVVKKISCVMEDNFEAELTNLKNTLTDDTE
jgi:hypothetical protein